MTERKAIHYGQVELIPGIVCDGYVLDDASSVLSERGTADLMDMDHKTLEAMGGNWPPKTLKSFLDKDYPMGGNWPETGTLRKKSVEVIAHNSPYCGRKIVVYSAGIIETFIRTYAMAFIQDGLRKNQIHIGKRAVSLLISLVKTALDAAIKEACGIRADIQKTAQKNYIDAVAVLQECGFRCSTPECLATKKDAMVRFHHKIGLETLFNGILQAKPGTIIRLYDLEHIPQVM